VARPRDIREHSERAENFMAIPLLMRLLIKLGFSVILTGGFVYFGAGGNWYCKFLKLLIFLVIFWRWSVIYGLKS
jgi:hypothetical protein